MNDDFDSLYAYNRWADGLILDACHKLTTEQYAAEPVPGWSSIRSSLVHIAIVTEGWLRGVAAVTGGLPPGLDLDDPEWTPTENDLGSVDLVAKHLARADATIAGVMDRLIPENLGRVYTFRRGQRSVDLPLWSVLRHIVNHATYHRGQVASKLARFGIQPPATDLIFWLMGQAGR